jgi:hypothetical protein
MEMSEGKPDELRFSITGKAARRLLVNLLLREYKIYKQGGAWETAALPEPAPEGPRERDLGGGQSPRKKRRKVGGGKAARRPHPPGH